MNSECLIEVDGLVKQFGARVRVAYRDLLVRGLGLPAVLRRVFNLLGVFKPGFASAQFAPGALRLRFGL